MAEGIAACLAIACHVVYWLDRLPLGAAPPPSFPPSCLPPPPPVLLFFDCWDLAVGEERFEVGCATESTRTVRARLVQVAEAALGAEESIAVGRKGLADVAESLRTCT